MNYIDRIENDKWIRKNERFPEKNIKLNRIIIHFSNMSKSWFVEQVELKNENGVQLYYNDGIDDNVKNFIGATNINPLYLCFDNGNLNDNSTFKIVLKIDKNRFSYQYVKSNNIWKFEEV